MKSILVKILLLLVFLALVANLAVSAVTGESVIGQDHVKLIAFAALLVANLSIAGAGIYFTSRSYQERERSSVRWGRRSFVLNVLITALLGLAPWLFFEVTEEFSRYEAMFNVSLILLLFGLSNGAFAYSFYREYVRSQRSWKRTARPEAGSHASSHR